MAMDLRIYESQSLDLHVNLALEEWLLEHLPAGARALFFWRSANAVVIGKNQNPWRECDLVELSRGGGQLGRRLSGGGAVYHDAGNLNFCFLCDRPAYDRDLLCGILLQALRELGVDLAVGPRHILLANGRKVSGNAFCFRRGRALHHGTLLLHTDLARLQRCLSPPLPIEECKGIASVPSPVVNLRELYPELNVGNVVQAISRATAAAFGLAAWRLVDPVREAGAALEPLRARHASWDWLFGQTPRFEIALPVARNEEPCPVHLGVDHGRIRTVNGVPAAVREQGPVQALIGRPFSPEGVLANLAEAGLDVTGMLDFAGGLL